MRLDAAAPLGTGRPRVGLHLAGRGRGGGRVLAWHQGFGCQKVVRLRELGQVESCGDAIGVRGLNSTPIPPLLVGVPEVANFGVHAGMGLLLCAPLTAGSCWLFRFLGFARAFGKSFRACVVGVLDLGAAWFRVLETEVKLLEGVALQPLVNHQPQATWTCGLRVLGGEGVQVGRGCKV